MMKTLIKGIALFAVLISVLSSCENATSADEKKHRTLIVFFDGLRPDYITEEYMPNLFALKKQGSYGTRHHSVFPTVTRVNSPSYATGSYPKSHGLMGNTIFFPQVEKAKGLNTGDAGELMKVAEATGDSLLTSPSLGEVLSAHGEKLMVFSSGSTGQAYLQNHKINGGAVVNPDLIIPASLEQELVSAIGEIPEKGKPNADRHRWVTDALIRLGLAADGPLVNAIWFSDPDGTAHAEGIGAPLAMESIKSVDHELGRIIEYLKSNDLLKSFNILVSTDHGFSTHVGKESLLDFLLEEGLKADKASDDIIVVGGAIYVKDRNEEVIKAVVSALQAKEWVGAIFTKADESDKSKGFAEGTLSFTAIHWDHPDRAADILVDVNWNDNENEYGYKGTTFSRGVAGHGSSSPWDIHIPLVVAGPSFRSNYQSDLPTSNVDLIPTLLHTYGFDVPAEMDGRVMQELFVNANDLSEAKIEKETVEATVSHEWGTYRLMLERTRLDSHLYVDYTKTSRIFSTAKKQ